MPWWRPQGTGDMGDMHSQRTAQRHSEVSVANASDMTPKQRGTDLTAAIPALISREIAMSLSKSDKINENE